MSDATAATNTGAPAPPPPQPTAGTSQAPTAVGQTSDAGAQQRMRNAIAFLNNAQVRASPLVRRVNFLKSKGMSAEEIVDAFSRANQPQSLETIKDIISGKIAAPAPPPPPAAAPVASPGSTAPPAAAPVAAAPPASPAYPYPPYPYPYPPPPPPNAPPPTAAKPAEGLTWKDYFIGATVGAAGLYAATKAFVAFSPYDIVRKDEWAAKRLEAPAPVVPAVRQSLPTLPTSGNGLAPSASFVFDRQATASLAPAQPTPPAVDTSAKDAEIESLKGQLDESQKQVTELKAEGDKLRREKADLAVNVGKLKGQIAALQRQIERSELTVESKIQERLAEQRRLLAPDPIAEALNGESGGSAAAAVPAPAEPAAAPPAASEAEAGSA